MKCKYWNLCSKTIDKIEKCIYAEHHWYQMQGYLVRDVYIYMLNDMEECPYYGSKEHNSEM